VEAVANRGVLDVGSSPDGHHRRHREAPGFSQEQFANKLGYHRTYVGGLERGERNLTLKAAERIASRLRLDPLELLRKPGK
jgi:transcriptional regulator with XRE-family HTH domain